MLPPPPDFSEIICKQDNAWCGGWPELNWSICRGLGEIDRFADIRRAGISLPYSGWCLSHTRVLTPPYTWNRNRKVPIKQHTLVLSNTYQMHILCSLLHNLSPCIIKSHLEYCCWLLWNNKKNVYLSSKYAKVEKTYQNYLTTLTKKRWCHWWKQFSL